MDERVGGCWMVGGWMVGNGWVEWSEPGSHSLDEPAVRVMGQGSKSTVLCPQLTK